MKKLILSVTAIAGLAMAGNAQQLLFSDSGTVNGSIDTTINGANNLNDLNLELLAGSGGTATVDVVTLLLSQTTSSVTTLLGTTQSAKGDISTSGGDIADQTINPYLVAAGTSDYEVLAWTGAFSSYAAAQAGGADVGSSGVIAFPVNGAPAAGAPPVTIDLAAPINLTATVVMPEPSTLAMAGVGLASMLFFRRKNK